MEQNETGCRAPQAPVLCVNNCGFFGAATTMNMCSKCYRDHVLQQEQTKLAVSSIQNFVNGNNSDIFVTTKAQTATSESASPQASSASPLSEQKEEVKEDPKRCGTCRKRVGLTGFSCRCGSIFCSIHRYTDKHECPFDYRSSAQEAIAKANPVVKAEKLDKI